MALNDSVALEHAAFSYRALASISRHNTRQGYDRAGFCFEKKTAGIGLAFRGHEVVIMGPGFSRDDVRAALRATVEAHLGQAVPAIRERLKAELCIPEGYFLSFDADYDLPRLLSTEIPSLSFRIYRCMGYTQASVSFSFEQQLLRVWSGKQVETFRGATYAEMLGPAIAFFNSSFLVLAPAT